MDLRKIPLVLLVIVVLTPSVATAVCLNPKTWISGYQVPLNDEIKSSLAIVIGRVIEEQRISDEPSGAVSAIIYKVVIERTLKGRVPATVMLWTPNDSSRYGMAARERHILFLTTSRDQNPSHYEADACGSSSTLPNGDPVVKQVEAAMRRSTQQERAGQR